MSNIQEYTCYVLSCHANGFYLQVNGNGSLDSVFHPLQDSIPPRFTQGWCRLKKERNKPDQAYDFRPREGSYALKK